jgi:hypothetical protein
MTFMFKEPNLERLEYGAGMPVPEVMVTDYAKKVRLVLLPEDKTASLQDLSTAYTTDEKTGELKSLGLETHARDSVLKISAQVVKDLGKANLNGQEVWALQSNDGAEPVKTCTSIPLTANPCRWNCIIRAAAHRSCMRTFGLTWTSMRGSSASKRPRVTRCTAGTTDPSSRSTI